MVTSPDAIGPMKKNTQNRKHFFGELKSGKTRILDPGLPEHMNLPESLIFRKSHPLQLAVTSSVLIRLQSSWYLSWIALSETFENRNFHILPRVIRPLRVPNVKRLSPKIQIEPAGRCAPPHPVWK